MFLRAYDPFAARGLSSLEMEIIRFVGPGPGYYIELGANDGVTQSNTLCLELFHDWNGVLIEPVPQNFRRLRKNRSSRRNALVNFACVSSSYADETVEIMSANLMSTPIGLESDIGDPISHAQSGATLLRKRDSMGLVRAPTMTLAQVLGMFKAPSEISLLSLDVEGAEIEVLKGVDFDRYRFKAIVIESRDVQNLEKFLVPLGYKKMARVSGLDYLFVPN